jgi:hypothetical protein
MGTVPSSSAWKTTFVFGILPPFTLPHSQAVDQPKIYRNFAKKVQAESHTPRPGRFGFHTLRPESLLRHRPRHPIVRQDRLHVRRMYATTHREILTRPGIVRPRDLDASNCSAELRMHVLEIVTVDSRTVSDTTVIYDCEPPLHYLQRDWAGRCETHEAEGDPEGRQSMASPRPDPLVPINPTGPRYPRPCAKLARSNASGVDFVDGPRLAGSKQGR